MYNISGMILPSQNIFFSGIGGSGMSALALFLTAKGHCVAGSDRAFDSDPDHPSRTMFTEKRVPLFPQDGKGLDSSFDLAVFSTAVEADNPDMKTARALGIPVRTRPDLLAHISSLFSTIAVAGTSGKSTTSGMLAFLMHRLGLDPNFIGGGRVKQFNSGYASGNAIGGDSPLLVIEACESDGTIVNYTPVHSVLLNLSHDHHSIDTTSDLFRAFIRNTREKVFVNADDKRLRALCEDNPVTFSINAPSRYKAEDIALDPLGSTFRVRDMVFKVSLPGVYNLSNALACIAVLSELGIPMKDIAGYLPDFSGIDRRFDIHLNDGTFLVIDDYAHNPHKIGSLMEAVNRFRDNVCYIFQPHGYAPARMLKDGYVSTFTQNLRPGDHLILLPIFYAGGTVSKDISSNDIAAAVQANGRFVRVAEDREAIPDMLGGSTTVVVMGARDETLSALASYIAGSIQTDRSIPVHRESIT